MLAAVTVKLVSNLLGLLACLCSLLASLCKHDKLLLPLLAWIPLAWTLLLTLALAFLNYSRSSFRNPQNMFYMLLYYALWSFVVFSHRHHLRRERQSMKEDGPGPLINHMLVYKIDVKVL